MYKSVTKLELINFIKNYPRKLEYNWFMGYGSYHDFSIGKEFDSIVARIGTEGEETYEIRSRT